MGKFGETFLNWEVMAQYAPRIAEGFFVTLQLAAVIVVTGLCAGLLFALIRTFRVRAVNIFIVLAVDVLRAIPPLVLIMILYFALPTVGVRLSGFVATWLALAAILAAFAEEIFWAGILAVPRGQWEAARSLGLHWAPTLWKVIFPQAAIVALRPLGNELILLIKASAVASIVTVLDLMGETRRAFSRSYDMAIYFYAAILYLALVETIRRLWAWMEARLTLHLRHEAETRRVRPADLAPAAH
jgi:polar amino acid transport system permease protein